MTLDQLQKSVDEVLELVRVLEGTPVAKTGLLTVVLQELSKAAGGAYANLRQDLPPSEKKTLADYEARKTDVFQQYAQHLQLKKRGPPQ